MSAYYAAMGDFKKLELVFKKKTRKQNRKTIFERFSQWNKAPKEMGEIDSSGRIGLRSENCFFRGRKKLRKGWVNIELKLNMEGKEIGPI